MLVIQMALSLEPQPAPVHLWELILGLTHLINQDNSIDSMRIPEEIRKGQTI